MKSKFLSGKNLKECKSISRELQDSSSTIRNDKVKLLEGGRQAKLLSKRPQHDYLSSKTDIGTNRKCIIIQLKLKSSTKQTEAKLH
jgi:hypothetical protein